MEVVAELPWARPGWRARAQAWIESQVDAAVGDAEEVKIRPWSAVLRQPTMAGEVYFKANLPALANEPGLTRLLHRISPEHVLDVLADEPGEGWMLQADGGPTMRSRLDGTDDIDRWERMLAIYAEVQVQAAGHADELLVEGAPDRRLPELRRLFEELVARKEETMLPLAGRAAELAGELDAFGLPATIDHSDLHSGNVLAPGDQYVIFDWHEGAVTHPFFSMMVATRWLEHNHGVEQGGADDRRLRDAYLEPWAGYGSRAELRAALELALRLGPLTRALGWDRVLGSMPAAAAGEWAENLSGWLEDVATELGRP
ncbi:MAG TPA: hypothetical protein VFW14_19945 [Gaiellales bacterium]|nr:hypothetical protein [Gaiellales bacterium]